MPGKVKISIEGDSIALEPDMVVPCGLIMSELLTDSLKRASAGGSPDEISIVLRDGERIMITYADNSKVQPEMAAGNKPENFSRQLVNMLIEQLDGTISNDMIQNAVIIEFPLKKKHA